jgi:UDP-glucose 4-epimerase
MTDKIGILITGAGGYLGGRLVKTLAESGKYKVSTTSRSPLPEVFQDFQPDFHWVGNYTDPEIWAEKEFEIETIIHLASPNEDKCANDPVGCINDHLRNTWELANHAGRNKIKRFIYMSTVHVYGNQLSGKISEDCPLNPAHPYSIMHASGENSIRYLGTQFGFEVIILRLSNSFGAPVHSDTSRWKLLVNDLCREIVTKETITLKTSGNQLRNFIPVTHLVDGLIHIIGKSNIDSGIYNLVSNKMMTVMEMALLIKENYWRKTMKGIRIEIGSNSLEKNSKFYFDNSKIRKSGFKSNDFFEVEILQLINECEKWKEQGLLLRN